MTRIYLTLKDGLLTAYVGPGGSFEDNQKRIIRSKSDYAALLAPDPEVLVVSSSSLDFPEDYTDNKSVIALCDWIRNPLKVG